MTVLDLLQTVALAVPRPVENIFAAVNAVTTALMQRASVLDLSMARDSDTVQTVKDQQFIALPTDCLILKSPPKCSGIPLTQMAGGDEGLYTSPGKPTRYRQEGRKLILAPMPNAVYPIFCSYSVLPALVTSVADSLPFGGMLDDSFPGLVALVMSAGRATLVTQGAQATINDALLPFMIAEEQALADSINYR